MARVNASQWLDKWGRRLSAAGPDITNGINRVTTSPGQLAAQAADRWALGVQQAAADGTFGNNVGKVSLQDWKDSMTTKGIPRLQQGIATAQAKKAGKITAFLSAVDAASADAQALPRGGLEQNIARSVAFQRSMAARAPKRQK